MASTAAFSKVDVFITVFKDGKNLKEESGEFAVPILLLSPVHSALSS